MFNKFQPTWNLVSTTESSLAIGLNGGMSIYQLLNKIPKRFHQKHLINIYAIERVKEWALPTPWLWGTPIL